MAEERSIFISYRRIDSQEIVGFIYQRLVAEFGNEAVFLDIHNIPPGRDYRKILRDSFSQCRVLLAVIGPDWLDARDSDNKRRLENPTDWVRLEIEAALKRTEEIPVVPLLVKGAEMPRAQELPGCLQDLAYRQKQEIRPGIDQSNDIKRLIEWLKLDLETSSIPSLWIHGWTHYAFVNTPQQVLDWTPHFDIKTRPRRIADQTTWQQTLFPSLRKATTTIAPPSTIDIRGKLPLTAALAVGTAFPKILGYTLQTEQVTDGLTSLWRSDADPQQSDMTFKAVENTGNPGENLLIALSISGRGWSDALQLFANPEHNFDAIVCAEPTAGTSERILSSDADAVALAISAKELIREYRSNYQAKTIHLLPYGPQGFFLFLGQYLRMVGDVVTYEWTGQTYTPSVTLDTAQV